MDNNGSKRITQAELARLIGVSRAAVNKALKSGRITAGEDGLFDPDQAVEAWKSNTRAAMKGAQESSDKPRRERGGQPKYASARARKELAQARIVELKEARLRGMYLRTASVEQTVFEIATEIRLRLENLPGGIAPELAHKDAVAIHGILKREILSVLNRMHDDFGKKLEELAEPDESEFPTVRI